MSGGGCAPVIGRFRIVRSSERGAELVEYAIVMPLLLLVLFGMAEFGLFFQAYGVVSNAAREGARMGTLACEDDPATCYSPTDIQDRVASFVSAGLPADAATPTTLAECVPVDPGAGGPTFRAERVTVTYTYSYKFIGPIGTLFGASYTSVPMVAVSTMRRENQSDCP